MIPTTVRPCTPTETQRWNLLNKGEEFIPIYYWPNFAAKLAIQDRLTVKERFVLINFLAFNGVHPIQIQAWLFYKRNLDKAAMRDIEIRTRTYKTYPCKYYDITLQNWQTYTP